MTDTTSTPAASPGAAAQPSPGSGPDGLAQLEATVAGLVQKELADYAALPPDVKPGHRTSEFALTSLLLVVVAVLLVIQVARGQPVDVGAAVSLLSAAFGVVGYAHSRATLKAAASA